ncbi:MAG: hypothetical protein JSU04_17060 [Bdellovibrionales bacterium]|nr:hypothetical protein [Bdellovibrionales bacterium]
MKKLFLSFLILATSFNAFAADKISVNINGKVYSCSGGSSAPTPPPAPQPYPTPPPQLVRMYCECSPKPLVSLRRMGVMSDASTTVISSQPFYPDNGSFSPDEAERKCQEALRDCR